MTLDEKIAAFKRGECPGCGSPLLRAVLGFHHYRPGAVVRAGSPSDAVQAGWEGPLAHLGGNVYEQTMLGGEPLSSRGANIAPGDPRVCAYDSDRLFTIQLLAGFREGKSMLRDEDYGQPSPRTVTP